jgi:hypothetical protein
MLSMRDIAQAFAKKLEEAEGTNDTTWMTRKAKLLHDQSDADYRMWLSGLGCSAAGSFADFRREQAMPVHDG